MESLKLNRDEIKVAIDGDENKIIGVDPSDLNTRKKFYNAREDFFKMRRELDIFMQKKDVDVTEMLQMEEDVFSKMSNLINEMFGENATKYICGDKVNITLLCDFIIAIAPYFKKYNENMKNKYVNNLKNNGVL